MADERVSSISKAKTLEEMAEFWDTHSLADYDDQTYEVDMTFDPAARNTSVSIEPELLGDLRWIAYRWPNFDSPKHSFLVRIAENAFYFGPM